jgi:hypothetical protein
MRFLSLIKATETTSGPPPAALMQAIGALGAQAAQAGVLVDTGGLMPTALGARVRVEGDKVFTIDGPFAAGSEVVGGYAIFNVSSKQEAIEWAARFMALHQQHWPGWEGESEVRQLVPIPAGAGRG